MPEMEALRGRLTKPVLALLDALTPEELDRLEEIRLRMGKPTELVIAGRSRDAAFVPDERQMRDLIAALSGYALYRCEAQLSQGYIALPGGHRAGVCGRMTRGEDGRLSMAEISSVCLRLARWIPEAGKDVYRHLLAPNGRARRVLLLGTPGSGKTTALRGCAAYLSDRAGLRVAAADERGELTALSQAGRRIDVLSGADKASAISMLIRTMSPQVIVTDEVGGDADVRAILEAARCGVGVTATAHADTFVDVLHRPSLRQLFDARAFERYVLLGWHGCVRGVWDETGRAMKREEADGDDVGCGGDGDDSDKRRRLFAL